MIVSEKVVINGKPYRKTCSDVGVYIRKIETGEIYTNAVDLETATWTYAETDIRIESTELTAEEALDIILGGEAREP